MSRRGGGEGADAGDSGWRAAASTDRPAAVLELPDFQREHRERPLYPVPVGVTNLFQNLVVLFLADVPAVALVFPNGKPLCVPGVVKFLGKHVTSTGDTENRSEGILYLNPDRRACKLCVNSTVSLPRNCHRRYGGDASLS
jgi:hypothetical protein